MKLEIYNLDTAKSAGDVEVADYVFGGPVREHLFWEVVNWQRARRRQGTHKTKGRSEKRGGGRKPWRQKGTGRARQGTIRAPQWVGGGTVFGPQPRDYSYKMPKKKRRAALRSALAQKAASSQIRVVESLEFPEIKTKQAVGVLDRFEAPKALFVDVTSRDADTNEVHHNENLRLSVRNLKNAKYLAAEGLNVEDLLHYDVLFISKPALEQVQEVLNR
jgi:large subunit ribosomal protein L4